MGLKQIYVLVLTVAYLACGGAIIFLLVERCVNYHGVFSVIGTLLVGVASMMYRAFPGVRTRTVKYIHLMSQMIAGGLFIGGYFFLEEESNAYASIHPIPGWVVVGAFGFQFLMAIFIFTYLYDNRRIRLYFAPFHDIIGIWIYICLVGCCIAGNRLDEQGLNEDAFKKYSFMVLMYGGFIIVVVVVLAPCLEWELIGYI